MPYIHIIILLQLAIFLFAGAMIYRTHKQESPIGIEKDFITKFFDRKKQQIERLSNWFTINWYIGLMIACPLAFGVIVYIFLQSGFWAVVVGCLGVLVPEVILRILSRNVEKDFETEYAKALQQLATSLKTGMNITEAVNEISKSTFISGNVKTRFVKLNADLQMGISIEDAFQRFADNAPGQDAQDVALALKVQTEVGGHEAEVVGDIAENIYDRIMLRKEINSTLAEPNMEIIIFDILPIAVILGFGFTNQTYMDVYFSSPGYMLLFVVFLLMPIAGSFYNHHAINKLRREA